MIPVALFLLVLIGVADRGEAASPELVRFESAPVQPSPFRLRLAQVRGEALVVEPGTPIQGYLFRPRGAGPFPAIVVLHGCVGQGKGLDGAWSERLAAWGYVALAVDSFGPRGIKDTCNKISNERPMDAYGALDYLTNLDAHRIIILNRPA